MVYYKNMAVNEHMALRIDSGGRVVIPAAVRRAFGVEPGQTIAARFEDRRLVLEPRDVVVERIRKRFQSVPPGVSLTAELFAERRAEAKREQLDSQ